MATLRNLNSNVTTTKFYKKMRAPIGSTSQEDESANRFNIVNKVIKVIK